MTTSANGQYHFDVTQGNNYTITPSKHNDVNITNGVTTLDIVMIQRHILNTQLLGSPYKIIAGDVNASGTVTNMDMVLIKSLILQNTFSFPVSSFWTFVSSSFVFGNPLNPFPYESVRAYSSAVAAIDQNFVAVRYGDVNNSWDPGVSKAQSSTLITFESENKHALPGDIITVPVKVSNFNSISGFQFTINWDPTVLEFQEAVNATLDMNYGTLNTQSGSLTTLWSTENLNGYNLSDGSTIFELKFRVIGNAGQSSLISINSEITPMFAYDNNLDELTCSVNEGTVTIDNITSISEISSDENQVLQNNPNPFTDKTEIIFTVKETGQFDIAIYDVLANRVIDFSGSYDAGKHLITWDGRNSEGLKLSNGNYYFILRSAEMIKVKKMILIK
jgi:hypothetical protein